MLHDYDSEGVLNTVDEQHEKHTSRNYNMIMPPAKINSNDVLLFSVVWIIQVCRECHMEPFWMMQTWLNDLMIE